MSARNSTGRAYEFGIGCLPHIKWLTLIFHKGITANYASHDQIVNSNHRPTYKSNFQHAISKTIEKQSGERA